MRTMLVCTLALSATTAAYAQRPVPVKPPRSASITVSGGRDGVSKVLNQSWIRPDGTGVWQWIVHGVTQKQLKNVQGTVWVDLAPQDFARGEHHPVTGGVSMRRTLVGPRKGEGSELRSWTEGNGQWLVVRYFAPRGKQGVTTAEFTDQQAGVNVHVAASPRGKVSVDAHGVPAGHPVVERAKAYALHKGRVTRIKKPKE